MQRPFSLLVVATLVALVGGAGMLSCVFEDDDGSEVVAEPPGPPPIGLDELVLYVEVDYHENTTLANSGVAAFDLVTYVEDFSSILVGDVVGFQCNQRFDEDEFAGLTKMVDMKVLHLDSAQVHWTNSTLVDEAKAVFQGTSDDRRVAQLLGVIKKGRDDQLQPNLHLVAAEYYELLPTSYTWPNNIGGTQLDQILFGIVFNGANYLNPSSPDPTVTCLYEASKPFPVGAIMVREIEKFVNEMNTYTFQYNCATPYSLAKHIRRVVFHELFHEIYLPDYTASPNTFCHDGDSDCRCVLNYDAPIRIRDLVASQNCITATQLINNSYTMCIDQEHQYDGCDWVQLTVYNN